MADLSRLVEELLIIELLKIPRNQETIDFLEDWLSQNT